MRSLVGFTAIAVILFACDDQRVYEKNTDFDSRYWMVSEKPAFDFEVPDSLSSYNVYCNVRNSLEYPYSRIFITWYLQDTLGTTIQKDLVQQMLFDDKTGEPLGDSGLGDLYDHRILLLENHRFSRSGRFRIAFEQFMRTDTLRGILSVGLRVERTAAQ